MKINEVEMKLSSQLCNYLVVNYLWEISIWDTNNDALLPTEIALQNVPLR
jgi:hypothetical protein